MKLSKDKLKVLEYIVSEDIMEPYDRRDSEYKCRGVLRCETCQVVPECSEIFGETTDENAFFTIEEFDNFKETNPEYFI